MKKIISLLFISILLVNCKGKTEENKQTFNVTVEKIDPQSFIDKIGATENAQIIDVRTPEEFNEQHLDNAENININDAGFDTNLEKLDKNKPVFVYCKSGGRSSDAVAKMEQLGFKEIYEMNGGMMKYNAMGLGNKKPEAGGLTVEAYNKLLDTDKKVVVDFYAEWCGPCKRMEPYLEKMKVDDKDKITVIRIDVDKNEALANAMKIESLPTVYIYQNKKKTWETVGYVSEEDLRKHL